MSTPDEMGGEWWEEFRKDLEENKLKIHQVS